MNFYLCLALCALLVFGCNADSDSFIVTDSNSQSVGTTEGTPSVAADTEDDVIIDPVTGKEVPPDPGEAGWEGEGIDSDGDGLRDDVQRWLAVNYASKFTLEEYRIAKTYAILFQRSLLYSDDKDKALNLVAEKHRLWDALTYFRVEKELQDFEAGNPDEAAVQNFLTNRIDELNAFSKGLEEAVINTNLRFITYREFDSQLGGEVFSFASSEADYQRAIATSKIIVNRELGEVE